MDIFLRYLKRLYVELAVLALVGLVLLWVLQLHLYMIGWLWGNITNFIYFTVLSYNVRKAGGMPPAQGVNFIKKTVLTRFSIVVLALLVAGMLPKIHILATGIGLLGFRAILYVDFLIHRNRNDYEPFQ